MTKREQAGPKRSASKASPVGVAEIGSRLDAARLDVDWLDQVSKRAAFYLEIDPTRAGAAHLSLCVRFARDASTATSQGQAQQAAYASGAALQAAWQAEIAEGRTMIDSGVKSFREAERANKRKAVAAEAERADWQAKANAIWARKPEHTATAVAKTIDPDRFDYIRKRITKPIR